MSQIGITMTANNADVLRKVEGNTRAVKGMEEGYRKTKKEANELVRASKRLYDETRTPAERHNAKINEANMLYRKGLIDVHTYRRAVRGAGEAGMMAFGSRALGQMQTYFTGLAAGALSLGTIKQLLTEIRETANQAGQRITDSASGRRALTQVSGGSMGTFHALLGSVEDVRGNEGLSAVDAYNLVFTAQSAGAEFARDARFFAQLQDINFNAEAGITSAQKLQAAFGGTGAGSAGAGTSRQIINKILAGAGPSPVMADKIAGAMAKTTVPFSQIGGQDEELIAMMGVLSEATETPADAAARIKSLSDQLVKKRGLIEGGENLEGLALIRALPGIAAAGGLSSEGGGKVDLNKFLGEANAIQAMELIQKLDPKITSRLADIQAAEAGTGTDADLFSQARNITMQDPQMAADKLARMAEQRRMLREENELGANERLVDSAIDLEAERRRANGVPEWAITGSGWWDRWYRFSRGNEAVLNEATGEGMGSMDEASKQLLRSAMSMDRAAANIQQTRLNRARDGE